MRYSAHGVGDVDSPTHELYGIQNEAGDWVIKPCLPDFIAATALEERMNLCAQLAAGTVKLTVPVLARLGISPEAFEDFKVYA